MKIIKTFLFLAVLMNSAHADIFSDIKKKAGSSPEAFWTKNRKHFSPTKYTYGPEAYLAVTIKPKHTVTGDEAPVCLDSTKNYKTAMSEYIFNMYLRIATSDKLSYLTKCEPNKDGLMGFEFLGVFDPLFINKNALSLIANTGNLEPWYWNFQTNDENQIKLIEMMKNIDVTYDLHNTDNQACDTMFINMLEKSMSYYGIEKSLNTKIVTSPNYSKVEPLYYYTAAPSAAMPSDTKQEFINVALATAAKRYAAGGDREFVYYYQGVDSEYEDRPGGKVVITKTENYTYRPVINECRALSYVVGSKLVDTVYGLSDVYEVWAVPHTVKDSNYLTMAKGVKMLNGKIPSTKWTYHVAIMAVVDNIPVVLDGLFYKEAVSLATWQKLFNPATRFMVRPFVKTKSIDSSFTKPTGKDVVITPHPVYQ